MAMPGRISTKALTNHLRHLAGEVSVDHFTDGGDVMTNEEALAKLIWRQALGWTEECTDEQGNKVKKKHLPVAWAQQFIWERTEGRAPVAMPENDGGLKAADKVRELARERLNKRTMAVVGVKPPPNYKP